MVSLFSLYCLLLFFGALMNTHFVSIIINFLKTDRKCFEDL